MKLLKCLPLHVWLISYLVMFSLGVFLNTAGIFAQTFNGNPQHGKILFEENCMECHGRTGDGTGPIGYFLAVEPADFLSIESRMKPDPELFTIIKNGILFDEMHGWEGTLSDQNIYNVVSCIRTLAPPRSQ